MVVNWYLAEKMVVNWEMGIPIKTLMKGWCVHSSSAVWGNVNDPVPDPDLEIRGRGRSSRPFDKVEGQKKFFRPCKPQFGLKVRGGPGLAGLSLGSATTSNFEQQAQQVAGNPSRRNFATETHPENAD